MTALAEFQTNVKTYLQVIRIHRSTNFLLHTAQKHFQTAASCCLKMLQTFSETYPQTNFPTHTRAIHSENGITSR